MLADSVRRLGGAARGVGILQGAVLARLGHQQQQQQQQHYSSATTPYPAELRSVLLLEHDIAQACEFFRQGLGGRVLVATEGWAEIEVGGRGAHGAQGSGGASLLLHLKKRDADGRHGLGDGGRDGGRDGDRDGGRGQPAGSPTTASNHAADTTNTSDISQTPLPSTMLVFRVDDVQSSLVNMLQHGGQMDGRIEYGPDGTTHAVVRSPGGTSVGIIGGVHE